MGKLIHSMNVSLDGFVETIHGPAGRATFGIAGQ
jgi:hypothetical protein